LCKLFFLYSAYFLKDRAATKAHRFDYVLAAQIDARHLYSMPDPDSIDPVVRAMAEAQIVGHPNGRVSTLLREILQHGFVTTERLQSLGLSEPRRARQDAVDRGFPIRSETVTLDNGRRIASYSLATAADIIESRKGRRAIPKAFRNVLLAHYECKDAITGAKLPPRVLTIDHRVPFQIAGDNGLAERDASAFMLLDGSSQRSKSWSCEQCRNFREIKDPNICGGCFWAHPDHYDHIAMQQTRRTDILWQGDDVPLHDRLREHARSQGVTVADLLRSLARRN